MNSHPPSIAAPTYGVASPDDTNLGCAPVSGGGEGTRLRELLNKQSPSSRDAKTRTFATANPSFGGRDACSSTAQSKLYERPQSRDRRDAKVPPTFAVKKEKAPKGFSPHGAVFSGGLELSLALLYTDHKLDAATVL
jgi:hypothetical protein